MQVNPVLWRGLLSLFNFFSIQSGEKDQTGFVLPPDVRLYSFVKFIIPEVNAIPELKEKVHTLAE